MADRWLRSVGLAVLAVLPLLLSGPSARSAERYVLAASWQPAFCEARTDKPECASQTEGRFDASHFTLHGLWPQPRDRAYCGVDPAVRAVDEAGRWDRLPAFGLTTETRAALARVMPGSMSFLDRHEWIKHGTCHGASPEGYFAESLRLMADLNGSPVRTLFADGIGRALTAEAIRAAFDAAFGAGAGRRVEIACRRSGVRRLIVEMRLALAGPITPQRGLSALLAAADEMPAGCASGIVDRVGTGLSDR